MSDNPLIVALDVKDKKEVKSLIKKIGDGVSIYKIGPVLFTKYGPEIVQTVHDMGKKVFLDLKLHDIPNTVAESISEIAKLGVFMLTVHTNGGRDMLMEAVGRVKEYGGEQPKILGVTILTSISEEVLHQDLNVAIPLLEQVVNLAKLAEDCGLSGIVASPLEVSAIRKFCGEDLLIVTPGIRPAGTSFNDQKRSATPKEAIQNGANYLVVGRPITQADNPSEMVQKILAEIK